MVEILVVGKRFFVWYNKINFDERDVDMSHIEKVDRNLQVANQIGRDDVVFYDVRTELFSVYGLQYENGKFRRLPEAVAKSVSEDVHALHAHTAGGRVRFRTDSEYVAIHAEMGSICRFSHMPMTGSAGFDLYVRENGEDKHIFTFVPPFDVKDSYESVAQFAKGEMREYTIHFPLYSEVRQLYIGVQEHAQLQPADGYRDCKPIVYYGSSITQGGCASRPGNAYQNMISRRFHCDHVNLGFSGSAKAEQTMADYISALDMSLFVYDYDHNAPTVEYLSETHEPMFRKIRQAHPQLPIIMLTRPRSWLNEQEVERLAVVRKTYENALAEGDQNVFFIAGTELMEQAGPDGTVDLSHPNDLGFASMAKVLGDEIERIMNFSKEN